MLRNPALIKITRNNEYPATLEIFPFYRQEGDYFIATDAFRIYEGYTGEDAHSATGRLDRYIHYLWQGVQTQPGYLGELRFTGSTLYEWSYQGNQLNEEEVLQVLDMLQSRQQTFIYARRPQTALVFCYDALHVRSWIKLTANRNSFLIFINGRYNAAIAPGIDGWQFTDGDIKDNGLKQAIIRRIKSYTSMS